MLQEGLSKTSVGRFGWRNPGDIFNEGLLSFQLTPNSLFRQVHGKKWCLKFRIGSKESLKEKVSALNWVSKEIEVPEAGYSLIFNVLSPGVVIKSEEKTATFTSDPDFNYCAFNLKGKLQTLKLKSEELIYDKSKDGALDKNWILLWYGKNKKDLQVIPVLLVFQRNPEFIRLMDGEISITYPDKIGHLVISTPFGLKSWIPKEADLWVKDFPEDIDHWCGFWSKVLLSYPVDCKEFYQVDDEEEQVKIMNEYRYLEIQDEWKTENLRIAPIPPILSFMKEQGYSVKVDGELINLNCPTFYGKLQATVKDKVSYSLPIPLLDNALLINVPEETELKTEINAQARDWLTTTLKNREKNGKLDYGGFVYRFPLLKMLLDGETRELLDKFWPFVFMMHLNQIEPPSWVSKKEPFTGKEFMHWKKLEGGDHDAAAGLSLIEIFNYVLWTGDWEFIRTNWDFIKQIYHYYEVVNDWAWMGTACRDYGGPGVGIDMAWDCWAGLGGMAKMAKAINDKPVYEHVCYFRAKEAIPTLMRFCKYREYLIHYGFQFEEGQTTSLVGEIEGGEMTLPPSYNTKYLGGRLKDVFAEGFVGGDALTIGVDWRPEGLIFLADVVPEAVKNYLEWVDKYCPDWYERPPVIKVGDFWQWEEQYVIQCCLSTLVYLRTLVYREPAEKLKDYLDRMFRISGENVDSYSLSEASYIYGVIAAMDCPVWLSSWEPARLLRADYSKDERVVKIELLHENGNTLLVKLRYKEPPLRVRINDRWLDRFLSYKEIKANEAGFYLDKNYICIKVKGEGAQRIELFFDLKSCYTGEKRD